MDPLLVVTALKAYDVSNPQIPIDDLAGEIRGRPRSCSAATALVVPSTRPACRPLVACWRHWRCSPCDAVALPRRKSDTKRGVAKKGDRRIRRSPFSSFARRGLLVRLGARRCAGLTGTQALGAVRDRLAPTRIQAIGRILARTPACRCPRTVGTRLTCHGNKVHTRRRARIEGRTDLRLAGPVLLPAAGGAFRIDGRQWLRNGTVSDAIAEIRTTLGDRIPDRLVARPQTRRRGRASLAARLRRSVLRTRFSSRGDHVVARTAA